MRVGVLSKFIVASLNKQIQAPHQPVPPLAINFTTMRVMMSFQGLNNCRLWQSWLMTIMDPQVHWDEDQFTWLFFFGWENQDRNILQEISLRLLGFSPSNRPMGSLKPRPEVVASDPQATSTTLCRWVWYFHHKWRCHAVPMTSYDIKKKHPTGSDSPARPCWKLSDFWPRLFCCSRNNCRCSSSCSCRCRCFTARIGLLVGRESINGKAGCGADLRGKVHMSMKIIIKP